MTAPGTTRPRPALVALIATLVPPAAWVAALGLSYLVQDFACTAYASAGRPPPTTAIGVTVVGLDAVLLALTVAAGVVAWRTHRHATPAENPALPSFLGLLGAFLAVAFGAGIAMIAVNPLVLEVCA